MKGVLWVLVITVTVAVVIQMTGRSLASANSGPNEEKISQKLSLENAESENEAAETIKKSAYSRRRSIDYSRRRSIDYSRRRSIDYSRRRSQYTTDQGRTSSSSGPELGTILLYVLVPIAVVGGLLGCCKCLAGCDDDEEEEEVPVRRRNVNIRLRGVQIRQSEDIVEEICEDNEHVDVYQNASYPDAPPPSYDDVCGDCDGGDGGD